MIDDYLHELRRELHAVGIRGPLRRRILAEAGDHLRSDADALDRFGVPQEVANVFAAELGTQASRRAAVGAFAALGIAGAVYAAAFVGLAFAGQPYDYPALGALAFAVIVIAPQVAFVSGSLALLRAWRHRRDPVRPSAELAVINRRTSVALLAGLATMGALALFDFELQARLAAWWVTFTFGSTAAASVLLVLAAVPAAGAARLRPQVAGAAGDVFDDLGLSRGSPWRLARRVALIVALVVWLAGLVASDPIDGALRGLFEASACLGGFALLGRFLGLRQKQSTPR